VGEAGEDDASVIYTDVYTRGAHDAPGLSWVRAYIGVFLRIRCASRHEICCLRMQRRERLRDRRRGVGDSFELGPLF